MGVRVSVVSDSDRLESNAGKSWKVRKSVESPVVIKRAINTNRS